MLDAVVGIDCATQARKVGLARAVGSGSSFKVTEAMTCGRSHAPADVVARWLDSKRSVLLALDAPLGWPLPLGEALGSHRAGLPLSVPGNMLFRRHTDRVVAERTGKTPLDVGADRIARTAHWALSFLDELRQELQEPIPLAWSTPFTHRVAAIEVYPAATLLARGVSLRGYKQSDGVRERELILEVMGHCIDLSQLDGVAALGVDALDAIACVLAGVDFLEGRAVPPDQMDLALREGWIWFSQRAAHGPINHGRAASESHGA